MPQSDLEYLEIFQDHVLGQIAWVCHLLPRFFVASFQVVWGIHCTWARGCTILLSWEVPRRLVGEPAALFDTNSITGACACYILLLVFWNFFAHSFHASTFVKKVQTCLGATIYLDLCLYIYIYIYRSV